METRVHSECSGKLCGFAAAGGDAGCDGGNGSCWSAYFIQAADSPFHPPALRDATARIKEILDPLVNGPDGRTLSFLHTPFGTLLAWVKHGEPVSADAVTSDSSDEEIAEALGLIVDTGETAQAY